MLLSFFSFLFTSSSPQRRAPSLSLAQDRNMTVTARASAARAVKSARELCGCTCSPARPLVARNAVSASARLFATSSRHESHDNPLVSAVCLAVIQSGLLGLTLSVSQGLPRNNAPPTMPRMQRGLPQKRKLPGVKKVVVVSSGKGGVGKSSVAGASGTVHSYPNGADRCTPRAE